MPDPFVPISNIISSDPLIAVDIDSLFTSQLAFLQGLNWKLLDYSFSKVQYSAEV